MKRYVVVWGLASEGSAAARVGSVAPRAPSSDRRGSVALIASEEGIAILGDGEKRMSRECEEEERINVNPDPKSLTLTVTLTQSPK